MSGDVAQKEKCGEVSLLTNPDHQKKKKKHWVILKYIVVDFEESIPG